jgi:hypothetical protein
MFGIISYLVIITSLVISPGIGTLPPPRLIFLSPTTTTPHISHTSCVYFHVQISQIPYPFMHLLELSVFTLPDSPDDEPELLGISSKFISPGSDLHSSSLNRRKRKEMAKKALQDYPNLIKYSNQRTEFDDSDGDLWVSEPEDMKFVARGLKNGHYRAVCKLKRRMIKSDVGVVLPPLIPTEVDVKFDVEQYDINIKMTHLNNAEINNVTTSSSTPAIGSGSDIDIPLTYFSTTPSLLINFTASMQRKTNFEGGTKGNDNMNNILLYRIPQDGSLSVKVNGQPHRGPLHAYKDGTSLLIGMLNDGPHLIELSPVDSLDGEPIPEAINIISKLNVIIKVPCRSGGIDILSPNGIVDDGHVVT